ncbi:hypothetical protein EDC54_11334 [Samsonia erythrinae]|uniref:Transposase n=1 Tax=Samsonia erythrinae TaxID=160434 RepID=A0A4R3VKU4_9GAMM|nr:hypothetical protein EDC54_11334 [Samsonia erythrinae]
MKKRFSDEQTINILREAEAGVSARALCRPRSRLSALKSRYWRNTASKVFCDAALDCGR